MKPKSALRSFLFLAGSSLLAASSLHAADGTWTTTTTNATFLWSAGGNWSGGTVANDPNFTAFFTSNLSGAANAFQTAALDSARSIGNITFTDSTTSSHNLTISNNGSALNILTLDVTTGAPIIDVTQSGRILSRSALRSRAMSGLTKNGAGALILTGAKTYTGNTTVNQGWLDFGASGPAGIGSHNLRRSRRWVRFTTVTNALLNRL